ncbi:methylated-DNA--[protein]-cysteine S-methyltransferase [Dokdonella sp.]|uniref:methylated-DNA--[protein]-cysteine S-methyltransferase n=1 Tax=Dokdonella sp. TaxID=2291710 RepID=UPI00352726CB
MYYDTIESPIGPILLAGDGHALQHVGLPEARRPFTIPAGWQHEPSRLAEPTRQFAAYFRGELTDFDLPLNAAGTAFQKKVWNALIGIPYGTTISYAELARRIDNPKASRAVGLANGANPLAIIVPCHRVIGANGSMTGYGGGLGAKRFLLALESGRAATADRLI